MTQNRLALGATPCSILIHRKEVITNTGKIFKSRFGPVIIFPHPTFVLRGFGAYVPINELRETIDKIKNGTLEIKNDQPDNTDVIR